MSDLQLKDIFTRASAGHVYAAAWGAARKAESAGKKKLAGELTTLARTFRSIGRYGPESHPINAFGIEPVTAAEVPQPFAALAREIAAMGAWQGDSMLVGFIPRSDGGGRRLYAKAHGKLVRYSAEPDVLPKAERQAAEHAAHAKAVEAEKQRLGKRKEEKAAKAVKESAPEVQPTKVADLPDEVRHLAKVLRDKDLLQTEWTPLGAIEWDGQDVRMFARLVGKVVRYGIAA
ncbi:hypothetical protein [Streptomyces sp. NPDC086776]|uniref:hypothetical protein n=1 Tax=Streptomyces sp. NPDC086776 TaxID=3365756 RepID=UPI0037FA181B